MSSLKILVCGDVEGHFKTLFTKVQSIHQKKGPFEYLLCVGDFFGAGNTEWDDVVAGKIVAPLTTYILGPNKYEHVKYYPDESSELAPNIIYLGKRGILTGSSGLKIAYLSGIEEKVSTKFSINQKDVSDLITSSSDCGVDVLLTSQWPQSVTKYAKQPDHQLDIGSSAIACLAKLLKPRYHFSGHSGIYYERLPYRNHQVLQELPVHSTRFIGLAPVENIEKMKWLYAFNIVPLCETKQLSDASGPITECPYGIEECKSQFFYDTGSGSEKRTKHENGKPNKKKQNFSLAQEQCWFCLTNPDLERQLLLSIGEHSYMTLAKGGIVSDHLLIIPTEHVKSSVELSDAAEKEVNAYKISLVKYFHDQGKDVVFFERNLMSPHLQIQIVPVPKSLSEEIKGCINEIAAGHGINFSDLSKFAVVKQVVPSKKSYFHLEIFIDKKSEERLLHIIEGNFPLQFGRMVLASESILNVPDRIDWKKCKIHPDEEIRIAEKFRERFKPYDFTKM